MKAKLTLIILLVVFAAAISAQNKTHKVYAKNKNQKARIYHGIKSGELTKVEAKSLKAQQIKINKMKKYALADNRITKKEKQKISRAKTHASKRIYAMKHNKRKRS